MSVSQRFVFDEEIPRIVFCPHTGKWSIQGVKYEKLNSTFLRYELFSTGSQLYLFGCRDEKCQGNNKTRMTSEFIDSLSMLLKKAYLKYKGFFQSTIFPLFSMMPEFEF